MSVNSYELRVVRENLRFLAVDKLRVMENAEKNSFLSYKLGSGLGKIRGKKEEIKVDKSVDKWL